MIIGIDASRANRRYKTGTEWYSFYVIKNLAELDSANTYRLYTNDTPSFELQEIIQNHPNFSIKVLKWPFNFFWTLGRLSLEMIFARPDILFVPAHTLPLFQPWKTITTIHDIAFARDKSLYYEKKLPTTTRLGEILLNAFVKVITFSRYEPNSVDYLDWSTRYAFKRAKKIITVSEFTNKEILEVYPKAPADKIIPIHNGYNNDLYKKINDPEQVESVLAKYSLTRPYFLYVGRLEKKKNTPALIEAFALFKEKNPGYNHKLVLIGSASYGFDEVKYIIEEFNLNKEVIMPGWVEELDLPYIYNGAVAFIFPTKHEGFGIPVIQSLACGLPTAVSDIPVLREVAGDSVLYFNPNSHRDIKRAMESLITDQLLREDLIKKGYLKAQEFSWRKCAEETLREILSL
ncbi:MAG: glycosyltransferase family 1 protein [Candidatus Falkowbacteria bacterium]|nr:glycosyltransferase family 1 protein [Candidatus Falkowbacteria bacterium]